MKCWGVCAQGESGEVKKGQLITTEDQETGQIGSRVYWMYMKVRPFPCTSSASCDPPGVTKPAHMEPHVCSQACPPLN